MTVYCYPVRGKQKSVDICTAFADGCGGEVVLDGRIRDGASMFYGVDHSNATIWRFAKGNGEDFYYADNSYFDSVRNVEYRITKNALQHDGHGSTSGERLYTLRVKISEWRRNGNHILLCPQSEQFMHDIAGYHGNWLANMKEALAGLTVRPLRVRAWNRDKAALSLTLGDDLRDAWALVTYSSAAAVSALIDGVPVISHVGACASMGHGLSSIEQPWMPRDRERFLGVLADNQFTIGELSDGTAWHAISSEVYPDGSARTGVPVIDH